MMCRALLLLVSVLALAPGGCGPVTFVVGVSPGDQKLTSTVVRSEPRASGQRVAIIDISGMIMNANRPGLLQQGENPVSLLQEKLDAAATDRSVRAVVLRLNTPGGTVNASDVMYREMRRFKERSGKPVVALMMDVAASGGYYVACAADTIVAYPSTVTGSVGVIVQTLSVKQGLSWIGVHTEAITSGPNKDAGSPLSELTDDHRAVLRKLVEDFYEQFVAVVRSNRPNIPAEQFQMLTDGRVFSGHEAAKYGVVDELGDLDVAFARAKELAGISAADLILYHRPLRYVGSPYAAASAAPTQVNMAQINLGGDTLGLGDAGVGFYYLWQPTWP
jgi:protease-4